MSQTLDTPNLLESLVSRCVTPRPDCLIWPDAVDRGYGRVHVDGAAKRVHRVVWELTHGPTPEGLTIDHLCRVRYCVNTEHMELVTLQENLARKPTSRLGARTCRNGHEYAVVGELAGSPGHGRCLACYMARRERRAARRKDTNAST